MGANDPNKVYVVPRMYSTYGTSTPNRSNGGQGNERTFLLEPERNPRARTVPYLAGIGNVVSYGTSVLYTVQRECHVDANIILLMRRSSFRIDSIQNSIQWVSAAARCRQHW